MPKSSFGIPAKKGFPMNDKTHQKLAIGGATRAFKAGNISKGTEERIKGEARAKLAKGGGMKKAEAKKDERKGERKMMKRKTETRHRESKGMKKHMGEQGKHEAVGDHAGYNIGMKKKR